LGDFDTTMITLWSRWIWFGLSGCFLVVALLLRPSPSPVSRPPAADDIKVKYLGTTTGGTRFGDFLEYDALLASDTNWWLNTGIPVEAGNSLRIENFCDCGFEARIGPDGKAFDSKAQDVYSLQPGFQISETGQLWLRRYSAIANYPRCKVSITLGKKNKGSSASLPTPPSPPPLPAEPVAVPPTLQQWTGYISDAKCASNHGAKVATDGHSNCATACIKKGEAAVLVTPEGKIYKINNQDAVKAHAGHKVTIDGHLVGDAVEIAKISN
jgi:hypothetical protein